MPFTETGFPNLVVFEPLIWNDARGYFFESFNEKVFSDAGVQSSFIQDNQALSSYGVIRGLHFQKPPYAQSKLIRVLSGSILDVAVDIRVGSPCFGKAFVIELSAANKKQLFVPKGFAHGYSVISETAEVLYKCDEFYNKSAEGGISYNDKNLQIDWKIQDGQEVVSEKDKEYPTLSNFTSDFIFNL